MKRAVVVASALLLAACGGSSKGAAAAPPTTSVTNTVRAAGPAEFAREARISGFGDKDFSDASDSQLLTVGNTICTGFTDQGLSYGQVSAGLDAASAHASESQVASLVKSAVTNLCPQEASQLP